MVPQKSDKSGKSEIATFCDPPRSDRLEKSEIATFREDLGADASKRLGLEADPWFPRGRISRNVGIRYTL